MSRAATLAERLFGLWNRFSLVPKMLALTLAVGVSIFVAVDIVQTKKLNALFESGLAERVGQRAHEDRGRFDRYVETYYHAAKLLVATRYFQDHAAGMRQSGRGEGVRVVEDLPPWLPDASVLRRFARIHYAVLIDGDGRVREVYSPRRIPPPPTLLSPSPLLVSRIHDQSFTTAVDGAPFVLAAQTVYDAREAPLATLVLASRIDGAFLVDAEGSFGAETIVALADPGGRIVVCSRPREIPPGTPLDELPARYLSAGKSFFDRGGSDLDLQFITFVPRAAYVRLSDSVMRAERLERLILSSIFVITFSAVIYWVTVRVGHLSRQIATVSREQLGLPTREVSGGDQLLALQLQFRFFAEEIVSSRDKLEKQAELLLREKTVYLDNVLASSSLAIIAVDLSHRVKYCNQAARDLFAGEAEFAVGAIVGGGAETGLLDGLLSAAEGAGGTDGVYERTLELPGTPDRRILAASVRRVLDREGVAIGQLLLARDETQRRRAEDAVRASEKKYRALHQSLIDGFVSVDMRGGIVDFNEPYRAMLGYAPEEIAKLTYQQITPERWHVHEQRIVEEQILPRGFSEVYQKEYRRKDGSVFPVELRTVIVRDDAGAPQGMWAIVRDITDRKEAEIRILAALHEKDLLLREIHHRVKNNLQIIGSLLYLQAEQVTEPNALKLLQESRDRIRSIALVHEKLFGARDLSRVDMAGYLESLAAHLSHVHDAGRRGVRIEVDVREVTLGIDVAATCGLIANELLSNALKYAFPGGRSGTVRVAATRGPDGTITLIVEDDGVGLPADLDVERLPSLGLRLVRQLVGQLLGRMSVSAVRGTRFQIAFQERIDRSKESTNGA